MRTFNAMNGLGRAAAALTLAGFVSTAALASANGLPRLDPTDGASGTVYNFVMQGSARSMDLAFPDRTFSWRGSFRVWQDPGMPDFSVTDMLVDTSGDGLPDRVLKCSGIVGRGRVGMRCSEDDGGLDVRLMMTGRAVTLSSGRIAFNKTGGRGYTDTHTLVFGFQSSQQ